MSKVTDKPLSEKNRRKHKLFRQYGWVLVGTFVIAGLLGFTTGFLDGYLQNAKAPPAWMFAVRDVITSPWLLVAVVLALFAWGVMWAIAYWRQIDELARAAHERAWFWGGSGALALGLSALAIGSSVPPFDEMTFPEMSHLQLITVGALSITFLMMVGYGVAWAVIWWRAR